MTGEASSATAGAATSGAATAVAASAAATTSGAALAAAPTAIDAAAVDEAHMRRALVLAAQGLYTTDPNPRVGCVLVRDGQVVGEGYHMRAGEPHAEVLALRAAGERAQGATAYVTLEPCSHTGRTPPCADALIAARIARVVCASVDPNPVVAGAGIGRLRAAGIAVSVGPMAQAARELNAGYFSRRERGRPFVRLKLAMSLDARTASGAGVQTWITQEAARADVQIWRARSSAVLTGAGTVLSDDPRLDVRLAYGSWIRQPLRVVLDSNLICPSTAKIFEGGRALVFAADEGVVGQAGASASRAGSLPVIRVPRSAGGLDLRAVINHLTVLEVNELLVESGPRVAASFLEARLVDELVIYMAPHFLGADAPPLAALHDLRAGAVSEFEFRDQRMVGNDLRLILTPKGA